MSGPETLSPGLETQFQHLSQGHEVDGEGQFEFEGSRQLSSENQQALQIQGCPLAHAVIIKNDLKDIIPTVDGCNGT